MKTISFIIFLFSFNAIAAGVISFKELGRPATDLFQNGETLTIPEAIQLREQGADLSLVDPKESDIWKKGGFANKELELSFSDGREFFFQGDIPSLDGNFRFNAKTYEKGKLGQGYTFLAGKKSFNTLLRNALLSKVGYQVLSMKRAKKITISFKSKIEKDEFIEKLKDKAIANPRVKRWVVEEDDRKLVLQDLVVMPQEQNIYNLSNGIMSADIVKGRRVLNALLVLFNLIDSPESINLLSFESYRINGDKVIFPYSLGSEFSPNIEDVKWMARKISKLSRQDWKEVISKADLPVEVSKLFLEKVISRRNKLLTILKVEHNNIEFNPQISHGELLKEGKLLKENWTGYASRFSFGDPETPLSNSEILNFVKSKFISNAISNSMSFFNTKFLKPDLNAQSIINEQYNKARLNYLFKVFDGTSSKTDLYFYSFPTLNGDIITNRSVNIGGIQGGESKIMLADSFGFRLNAGMRVGTFDFPIETGIKAGAEVSISRVYTHLTPLLSLKRALNTPFQNVLVNFSQKKIYKDCEAIFGLEESITNESIDNCYNLLDENFEIGESLIITDNLDFGGNLQYTQNFSTLLNASAAISAKAFTVRKVHLHRKSKDEFQLFINNGLKGSLSLSLGLNYGVQILSLQGQLTKGRLKTKFYPWKLEKGGKKIKFLKGLMRYIKEGQTDLIRAEGQPYKLVHDFGNSQVDLNFLIWQSTWRSNKVRSTLVHQDDSEEKYAKEFLTYTRGRRTGKNYIQLLNNTLGELLSDPSDNNVNFDFGNDRDPANTPFGHAHTREVSYEGEVLKENKKETLSDSQVRIKLNWRGWKIKKQKADAIVAQINSMFSFPFFHKDIFNQTENIQIYNIGINISLYKDFIEKIASFDKEKIKSFIKETKGITEEGITPANDKLRNTLTLVDYYQKEWRENAGNSKNVDKAAKAITKLVSTLESYITFKELAELIGSDHYYATGFVHGFREGDENGDEGYFSHGMGTVGSQFANGKLDHFRRETGMIPNEYYGHWFIGRL